MIDRCIINQPIHKFSIYVELESLGETIIVTLELTKGSFFKAYMVLHIVEQHDEFSECHLFSNAGAIGREVCQWRDSGNHSGCPGMSHNRSQMSP